ncbi:thiamine diphosphokinase [Suttonella sp. R2A3]|uniref:thiamine diphosphokinase n=1 Tax=Suttonella sp. R2A3 TaxID=2908648 RepID=UPI001F263D80|nr:thiamine diphosphokinase [Suttonella sp. R2A3]UJF24006.1 thiamine diphosphokinase [Suttonella sp. R2A3]
MRTWLLLAGDYARPQWQVAAQDRVVAVDGGIRHAQSLAVTPDCWIGDFDSTDEALLCQYAAIPQQRHPQNKDATDGELALSVVRRDYPQTKELSIVGGFGDELDHVFANLWVLPNFGLPAVFWGRAQQVIFLPAHAHLCAELALGSTISVFALTPLRDVHYEGLAWPAPQAGIEPFSALASRNHNTQANIDIGWHSGDGLVIINAPLDALTIDHLANK